MSTKQKISICCYILIPTVAMIAQIFIYGIYLVLVATSIAVVMMLMFMISDYVRMYVDKEKELLESRISIMRSQIKPHFLYNSLTAIASLCDSAPKTAQKATIAFADYLRSNMNSLDSKDLIEFTAELKHIKNYLYLEQLRFGDKLKVEYDIRSTNFRIPALSIQPMIENAVKWGVGKKESGGCIRFSTYEDENAHIITVEDDGIGFDVSAIASDGKTHIGIDNVSRRIRTICHGKMEIHSAEGKGTTVRISIPKENEHEVNADRGD